MQNLDDYNPDTGEYNIDHKTLNQFVSRYTYL